MQKINLILLLSFLSLCIPQEIINTNIGLANSSRSVSGYYGFWTTHIGEGISNNNNYSKLIMYDRWVLGHSINSSNNHSILLGRCLAIKQMYFTNSFFPENSIFYFTNFLFAEYKFNVAVASGYFRENGDDGGNLPGGKGLMFGMTASFGLGYRITSNLEGLGEFLYLPTPWGGVINLGISFRRTF